MTGDCVGNDKPGVLFLKIIKEMKTCKTINKLHGAEAMLIIYSRSSDIKGESGEPKKFKWCVVGGWSWMGGLTNYFVTPNLS